jgi:ubiquinone biosynthesis protein
MPSIVKCQSEEENPMFGASDFGARLRQLTPQQMRSALAGFVPAGGTPAEKITAIEAALRSPLGQSMRDAMARWIVDEIVPVERLVPEAYLRWRPPVRDSMTFVVSRLSPPRLAPKLLQQIELPPRTSAEKRLLLLISKVPGLQKLGQVIARNQHLRPALRNALARLENGIRDVEPAEIRSIIERQLGPRLEKYRVKIATKILSEASVSAVVRFTWRNPENAQREAGVFKVLKPHIPEYFAEDMDYLQGLADYFGERHHRYGFPAHLIPDTFKKVRRLLQHEVNFVREQQTLVEAATLYRNIAGVRVPRVIRPLCTPAITALSAEQGIKVTNAAAHLPPARRRRIAEQLVEALVAVPLLAEREEAVFHGDPHAGNLLYDNRTGNLTIIDWALRERLNREQRRHLAMLFLTVTLRDGVGVCEQVSALSEHHIARESPRGRLICSTISDFLDDLPVRRLPSGADAMRLLERVALKGVRFPSALIMLSKVMFTLDGLLHDVGWDDGGMGLAIARHVVQHWIGNRRSFRSPLKARDWFVLQCSALLYPSRLWLTGEQALLDRYLPPMRAAKSVMVN